MKSELIHSLTGDFESFAHKTPEGVEFWLARDLQHLLGYKEWRNFLAVLHKAQTSCEVRGKSISDHFVEVNKMVGIGSNTNREIQDFMLTRMGCGSPKKDKHPMEPTSITDAERWPSIPKGAEKKVS